MASQDHPRPVLQLPIDVIPLGKYSESFSVPL